MPFFNQRPDRRPGQQSRPTTGTRVMADMIGARYGGLAPVTSWSGQRYEQVMHYKYWIFVALNARGNKVASIMPNVGRIVPSEPAAHKFIKMGPRRNVIKAQTPLRDSEDIEPYEMDHALVELLNKPNQYETAFSIWKQTDLFLGLTGNAYWWIPPSAFGTPAEIHVIPSHWMIPRCYDPDAGHIIDYYDCRPIANAGYAAMHFPASEIVHFKEDSPLSKIDGQSPTAAGDRWFDISEATDQSQWNAMKQSINASGVIELSADFYDPDDSEINRLQMKFLQNAGERRAGKPIILSPGMKFTPLMISARELDFNQSQEGCRDKALAIFGTPKSVVGIVDTVTRANHEGSLVSWCSNIINPLTKARGEQATMGLARRFDDQAVIWFDDASPSDAAQINQDLEKDMAAGTITKGEWRQMRGRPLFGDERDDEIAGTESQPEGGAGPDMDNLFDEGEPEGGADPAGDPLAAGDRMTDAETGAGNQDRFQNSMLEAVNGKAH